MKEGERKNLEPLSPETLNIHPECTRIPGDLSVCAQAGEIAPPLGTFESFWTSEAKVPIFNTLWKRPL
jgi:hypothetical protein